MRVAMFFAVRNPYASGHDTYQATLLEGLAAEPDLELAVIAPHNEEVPPLAEPHRVVRYRQTRPLWMRAVHIDPGAEWRAARAAKAVEPDVILHNAQWP